MNVRLTAALVLTAFMPAGWFYQSLNVDPPEAWIIGFLGYVFTVAYLIATGYNQLNKGKPF